jgi:crotonobetainyl-CoA:carnitine CoA-transferase CaiB-like acyl-CoA transferase
MTTKNAETRRAPLEGIRVLDCGTIIAAPYCAALLADWGAEVIKIEHPSGDGMRQAGPSKNGAGLNYKFYGRNKRNIVLDLSKPQGQEVMRGLVARSDVVIENFRPGVMERWKLGWDELHALNEALVMLRVTGFGQFGPYASRAGFGTLAESMSGYAHINGYPDGPPTLPPFGLADGVAALTGAYAVMLALYQRDARGGQGQMIDVALIEPIYHLLGGQTTIFDQLGIIQKRSGNRSANNAPRNTYRTRDDRWVAVSAASQSIAERVMRMIGRPEIAAEPWFATGPGRARHGDEIDEMVGAWIAARDSDAVMQAFEEAGAAVAPIYDIAQLVDDPQYRALNSVVSLPDEELGSVRMQNLPFRMSAGLGAVQHGGRRLGRDTDAVLQEVLGLSEEALRALHEAGVTRPKS